jgi:predicted nucleic acid-binding protein
MPALLDTGILYALADRDDAWHERSVEYVSSLHEPVLTTVTAVPEAAYLIRERLGKAAELRLIRSIANRELHVEDLREADWARTSELMLTYPDIGFVDASLAAVAERLRLTAIVTTDRRHFASIRPRHRAAFELLPD